MEPLGQTVTVPVHNASDAAWARRTARAQGLRAGLPASRADDVEIATVELATNLLHHGGGGTILLNAFVHDGVLEVLSVDAGPGIADLEASSADGFSTGSTPGLGLGSVRRLADVFGSYSVPGKGTVLVAQFGATSLPSPLRSPLPGIVCTTFPGEEVSGDRWASRRQGAQDLYLVVDGLGHGLHASTAATAAVEIFLNASSMSPSELILQMHGPMHSTRGAAMAIVSFDHERSVASYCGVGNISSTLQRGGRVVNLISQNGTVGHQLRGTRTYDYPYAAGDLLIMHSDGVSARWRMDGYPGLFESLPAAVAAVLHRDFNRGRDDATVLAVRL